MEHRHTHQHTQRTHTPPSNFSASSVVQLCVDDVFEFTTCSASGIVESTSRVTFLKTRISDLRAAIVRAFVPNKTGIKSPEVRISVCTGGASETLAKIKHQHTVVSQYNLDRTAVFIVGVSESLYSYYHHELLYPDQSKREVRLPTILFPISDTIFREEETNVLGSDAHLWRVLNAKVTAVLVHIKQAAANSRSLDTPLLSPVRLVCQTSSLSCVWDSYYGRLLRKVNSGSASESGPLFKGLSLTSPVLLDRDVLETLSGGPCYDGTQDQELTSTLKHYTDYNPRYVKPGIYRTQIAHMTFNRPIMLQVLCAFHKLTDYFDLPLDGSFYEIKDRVKRKKRAFFVSDKNKENVKVKESLFVDPALKDFAIIAKLFQKYAAFANDRSVLTWLVDQQSPYYNPHRSAVMNQKMIPLMYKVVLETIQALNQSLGNLQIQPIAIWESGLLLGFPTTLSNKAMAASKMVSSHLTVTEILRGMLTPSSLNHYKHGLQIDYRNQMFIDEDYEIVFASFPYLESLPPGLSGAVEESLVHVMNEPVVLAQEKSGHRNPSREALQQAAAEWLSETWGCRVRDMIGWAINRVEEEPLVFDSEIVGFIPTDDLDVKTAVQRFMVHVAMLDQGFSAKNDEEMREWLQRYVDEDFNLDTSRSYSSTLPILLPDMVCERCHHVECLDLGIPTNDDGAFECIECAHPFNDGLIESRLVQILEYHITSLQNPEVHCKKCRALKALRCAKFCDCGHKFKVATTQTDTK
eukprot:Blabericola_migrator_1__11569@NODE_692_length_6847_cov_50_323894_g502_i0_p2_GENE_NODE_692_length_6847_cov_50_323894_g502_i0NODE_692_length_6847_cov_50_323894_g502_i0_p2_ORF_typecomplete_len749_score125_13_NODE_692_length_6847_cov_50_323894_g502_i01072353